MTDTLRSIYYDVENPSSFGSVDKLYRAALSKNKNIKRSDVEKFLSGEIPYTLHRRIVRRFDRNPVISNFHGDLAQADLIDVRKFSKENEGYNFILTLIDVFSKIAFAVPIKRKTSSEMTAALKLIFKSYRPNKLQTDEGTEFTNNIVQKLLKEMLVSFFLAKNERIKCAVIERFQRTLMSRLFKYFTAKGTRRYLDILDKVMAAYNNCYHCSIRMTPIQAMRSDTSVVFKNLYGQESLRNLLKKGRKESKRKVGDTVRIPAQKSTFQKGYTQNFTDKIYKVVNVNKSLKEPVFTLETHDKNKISGNFYRHEIQNVSNSDKYRVIVLKERKRGRSKEYLIQWENFPELEPEWISSKQLESLS